MKPNVPQPRPDPSASAVPPTDYAPISTVYDQARPVDRPHVEAWLRRMIDAGGLAQGKVLLDLGCGTGRWGLPLAERSGCRVIGVDNSPEMLAKAREKDTARRGEWLLGDVADPPVPRESCDCALMSLVLHFLPDASAVFVAVRDRLRPGGVLLVRQPTLEQVAGDPIHRFFPESLEIERRRTPLLREIEFWIAEAGFDLARVEPIRVRSCHAIEDWFRELDLRVPSILRLLPDDVYRLGLARARRYMAEHPDDATLLDSEMTLFVAKKPA